MRIDVVTRAIKISFDDDEISGDMPDSITYQYGMYVRLAKATYKESFDHVNLWLSSLPLSVRRRLVRFYNNTNAHLHLNDPGSDAVKAIVAKIALEVKNIEDLLDYKQVIIWNKEVECFPIVVLDKVNLIKEEDLKPTTYDDNEAYELECFSVIVKLLTPVFGKLAEVVKKDTSTGWKEKKCLEIIETSSFIQCAPYKKLLAYCNEKARLSSNKVSPAANRGVTEENLKRGTMAMAITKIMATYNIDSAKDIIRTVFQDVKTFIDTSSSASYQDKGSAAGSTSSEDDGVAQHWRRGQDTQASDRATTSAALLDIKLMLRDMELEGFCSVRDVTTLQNKLLKDPNNITPIHTSIMGRAFIVNKRQVIHCRILDVLKDPKAFRCAQALAYYRFLKLGCQDIADFVISKYLTKDAGIHTMGSMITPLTKEQDQELATKYPTINPLRNNQRDKQSPAKKKMDELATFITLHDFDGGVKLNNVRQELFKLALKLN